MLVRVVYCQSNTYVPAVETCGRETRLWPKYVYDGNQSLTKDESASELDWLKSIYTNTFLYDVRYRADYYYILSKDYLPYQDTYINSFSRVQVNPALGTPVTGYKETIYRNEVTMITSKTISILEFTEGYAIRESHSNKTITFLIDDANKITILFSECEETGVASFINYFPTPSMTESILAFLKPSEQSSNTSQQSSNLMPWWYSVNTIDNLPEAICIDDMSNSYDYFTPPFLYAAYVRIFPNSTTSPLIAHTPNGIVIRKDIYRDSEEQTIGDSHIHAIAVYHDVEKYTYILANHYVNGLTLFRAILSNDNWAWPSEPKHLNIPYQFDDPAIYFIFYNDRSNIIITSGPDIYIPTSQETCYTCPMGSIPLTSPLRKTWCTIESTTSQYEPTTQSSITTIQLPTTIAAYTTTTTQPLATETPIVTTAATTQNSTTTAENTTAANTYTPAIETCGNETKLWPERIFDGSATFVRDANASETWALDSTFYIGDIKYIRGYYYILKIYPESTTITLERRRVDPVLGITLSIEIIDTFADYQGVLIEFTNGIAVGLRRTHTILLFIIHENENERIEKFTAPCASEFYHIMPLDYYPRQSTNVPLYGMYSQATLPFQPVHYKFWKLTQTSQVSQPQITCDLNTSNPIIFSTQFEVRFHRGWIRTFDNHKNTPLIIHSTYSIFIYKDIDTQAEMQSIEVQGKIIESAAVFHDIGEYTYIFIEIYGGTFFMYRMILSHSQWTWPEEYKQINLQNSGNVGIRGHYLFYNYVSHVLLVRPHGIYVPTENVNCYTCDNSSRPLDNTPRRTWCIKQETTTQMQPTTTITQQPFTSIPTTFTTATTAQNSTTTAENTTFTTQPFTTETPVATTATTTQTLATSTESTTATTQEPTTATTSTTIAPELTTATTTHQPTTATVTANQTTTPLTTTKSSNGDTTTPTPHVKYYTGVVFDRTSGTPRYPEMSTSIAISLAILCVFVNKQT